MSRENDVLEMRSGNVVPVSEGVRGCPGLLLPPAGAGQTGVSVASVVDGKVTPSQWTQN